MSDIQAVRERLRNPPNAKPDYGIDLKRPKDWTPPHLVMVASEPEPPNEWKPIEPTVPVDGSMEILGAVAHHLHTTIQSVLFDVGAAARHGRRMAMGLVMLRLDIDRDAAARIFNVMPEAADDARAAVAAIMREQMIPLGTPINEILPLMLDGDKPGDFYSVKDIQKAVSRASGVSMNDLNSPRRFAEVTRARMIAIALAKRFTSKSLPALGLCFGGRDHTTVLHSVRKMQPLIDKVSRRMTPSSTLDDWTTACLVTDLD